VSLGPPQYDTKNKSDDEMREVEKEELMQWTKDILWNKTGSIIFDNRAIRCFHDEYGSTFRVHELVRY